MDEREGNLCLQSVRRACFQTNVTDAFMTGKNKRSGTDWYSLETLKDSRL